MSALAVELDCEEIETLLYKRLEGRDRGWRVELLLEQLTSKVEQKLLLCSYCNGLMRDACVMEKEGKQELRCHVCIPEGTACHEAQTNREAIDEKIVSKYVCLSVISMFIYVCCVDPVSIGRERLQLERHGEQRVTTHEGM